MASFRYRLSNERGPVQATNIPAALAVGVIVVFGLFAEFQSNQVHQQGMRAGVLAEASVIRAKLEGNVNANLQLVRGLIATLITEPDMDQARFEQLAANLFQEDSQLRSVAVAPDLVVTMTYPLAGNEQAIGLDYRANEAQREAALRVVETGELVLAGPVDLVQGGRGFIGRFPVYVDRGPGEDRFWGLVAAVIDVDRLYRDSGLLADDLGIEVGIVGKDALGRTGRQFFGDAGLFDRQPVLAEVILPSGSWVVGAVPRGGWDAASPNAWLLRGLTMLLGALIVFPMVVGGRLMEERQRNLRALGNREAELQRLSRRLGLALETSKVGVWEYDIVTGDLVWDDRMNEIYGLPADRGPRQYRHWRDRLHPDDLERAREDFRIAVEVTGQYNSDYRIVTPAGEIRNVRAIGRVYEDPGTTAKIVGVNWDVTTDVALNERLKQANRVSEAQCRARGGQGPHRAQLAARLLTGLPNRRYLDDTLKRHAARCVLDGRQLALLHIDLDRFKQINDTLGHAAGDAMLVHASEVLKSKLRADDFVARIGGDEFVVVCTADGDQATLANLAERIIETMRQPVSYEGHECRFGVSVGIAVEKGAGVDPQRLLINADIALYRAKSAGRDRYEFFTEALQADVVRTKRVADEILNGLEHQQFVPFYQPQFDAHTLDVVGAEALARWFHPTDGIVMPSGFMDVAEDLNVVSTIDRMILEQALRQLADWTAAGIEVPRLSVNVSARRLQDENLARTLRELDIRPGMVSFELVESIFLDESDDVVLFNIDQIKELGIDIEIDDFGTGYASIVSLLKLAETAQDRPAAGRAHRRLAGPAPPRRIDHRHRQVARHRGAGRGRRDARACPYPARHRLRHPAGLRLRAADERDRPHRLPRRRQLAHAGRGAAWRAPAVGARRRPLAARPLLAPPFPQDAGTGRTTHAQTARRRRRDAPEEMPRPVAGPGEVVVRVEACGVCGSDRHMFRGEYPTALPVTLGHEFCGIVAEAGPGVSRLAPGTRITCDPNIACGHCPACRAGRPNLCDNLTAIGVFRDGGFADYVRVPELQAIALPVALPPLHGAFSEPLACCLHGSTSPASRPALVKSRRRRHRVIMVQLARLAGAGRVIPRPGRSRGATSPDARGDAGRRRARRCRGARRPRRRRAGRRRRPRMRRGRPRAVAGPRPARRHGRRLRRRRQGRDRPGRALCRAHQGAAHRGRLAQPVHPCAGGADDRRRPARARSAGQPHGAARRGAGHRRQHAGAGRDQGRRHSRLIESISLIWPEF